MMSIQSKDHSSAGDRRKIVYLDHVARLSGGEIGLQRLLSALPASVQAHVILGEDGPLVDRLMAQGTSVEVLSLGASVRNLRKEKVLPGLTSLSAIPATALYVLRLTRKLRRLRPDVVHANSLKAGVYGCLAARLAGVPAVWHVRDNIDSDYLPRVAVLLMRAMIPRLAGTVVANSQATLRSLGSQRPGVDYSVVYDVAPLPSSRSDPAPNGDGLRIGIIGRLAPWKGQDIFLDAFAQAFPEGPHRAIIVGSALFGEDSYAGSLRRRAAALGIDDRVEFRGFREDVMAELGQLDILVHASITPEPFGMVILEAFVAGVVVVAAAGGGPSEIVTDGVNGLLYPAGDANALLSCFSSWSAMRLSVLDWPRPAANGLRISILPSSRSR